MKRHTIILSLVIFGCSSAAGETLFSGGAGGALSSSSTATAGGTVAPIASSSSTGDAGLDTAEEPDAAPCIHCAPLLDVDAKADDVALLCDESRPLWKALHDDCGCSGICAGPCTQSLGDGRTWCADLAFVQMCSACLASDPGCGGPRQACLNDIGGAQ